MCVCVCVCVCVGGGGSYSFRYTDTAEISQVRTKKGIGLAHSVSRLQRYGIRFSDMNDLNYFKSQIAVWSGPVCSCTFCSVKQFLLICCQCVFYFINCVFIYCVLVFFFIFLFFFIFFFCLFNTLALINVLIETLYCSVKIVLKTFNLEFIKQYLLLIFIY